MAPTARAVRYIAALRIALEYFNRFPPAPGRGRNLVERDIARRARLWCERYRGDHWGSIRRNPGAFDAVHPQLFNRRVRPYNRIAPYHLAVFNAGHGNPGGMSAGTRRISRNLTLAELADILDSRQLTNVTPGPELVQLVSVNDLYALSAVFDYLPEFMVELGCFWRR